MKYSTKAYPNKPIPFLIHYALKNKWIVLIALFFGALEVAAEKLSPLFFSKITGLFNEDTDFSAIKSKFFLFIGLYVVMELLSRAFYYITKKSIEVKLGPKLIKDIATDLFYYLHGHSLEYFSNNMAGKLADKVRGAAEVASGISEDVLFFIRMFFNFIVTIIMFAAIDIMFSASYLAIVIISWMYFYHISKSISKKRKELAQSRSEVSANFIDAFQNIFFIKIFNAQKYEEKRFLNNMQEEGKKQKSYGLTDLAQSNIKFLFYTILNISYLIYALYLWKEGIIKAESVVLVFFLINQTSGIMEQLLYLVIKLNNKLAELEAHLEPFAVEHDIKDATNAKKLKVKEGKIEFNNISFAYKEGKDVFNNFSLTIKPKQKIGIVGASGCGKSTLINLLQRFYDIDSGSIKIGNKDIKKITQDSLRQNISLISQSTHLFDRSLKENIAYGKQNAKEEDIIKAAKNAYAHEFIKDLEEGYNTILKGTKKLSGGQMQRISIARALLEDAPILVLDEATSSLDSLSESYIQKSIAKLIKNKTVIAIAHRLSTLKNMDRIIFIEDGKIIEDGTIKQLLSKKTKFKEFWNMQKLKEGEKDEKK